MRFNAVLFDFGDTLVQTKEGIHADLLKSLHESLTLNGINIPLEELKEAYFDVRRRQHEIIRKTLRETDFRHRVSETLSCFGYTFKLDDKIIIDACEAFFKPFIDTTTIVESARMTLQKLKQKYKLGAVSDFLYPPVLRKMFKKFELAGYFEAIVISGEVGWRKPHPAIFQTALKLLEVGPQETIFVGDSIRRDIVPAKKLGMGAILIDPHGKALVNELPEDERPDVVVSKLEDILRVL
jgi:putative hydrolase of the HAD superfamily